VSQETGEGRVTKHPPLAFAADAWAFSSRMHATGKPLLGQAAQAAC
jgi:hypothetical protein